MAIEITCKNIKLGKDLKEMIKNELEEFEHMAQKIFNIDERRNNPATKIGLSISKETYHHKKGPFYCTYLHYSLPGANFDAKSEGEDIYLSFKEAKKELERQIKSFDKKKLDRYIKGARKLKKILRGSKAK